jgi:hypothetical protein
MENDRRPAGRGAARGVETTVVGDERDERERR